MKIFTAKVAKKSKSIIYIIVDLYLSINITFKLVIGIGVQLSTLLQCLLLVYSGQSIRLIFVCCVVRN